MSGNPLRRMTRVEMASLDMDEPDWFELFLDGVAEGRSLAEFCGGRGWSRGAVSRWIDDDQNRAAAYWDAKRISGDMRVDEILPIADDGGIVVDGVRFPSDPQRDKLRVETRLKLAGKFDRARYGEHVRVEREVLPVDDGLLLAGMVELLRLAGAGALPRPVERVIEAEDAP